MCGWMGSHFHNPIDYNGVAFSIELLEWSHIFVDFGVRICRQVGSFRIKKYKKICGTKMRVKFVFYIHFNQCVNPF